MIRNFSYDDLHNIDLRRELPVGRKLRKYAVQRHQACESPTSARSSLQVGLHVFKAISVVVATTSLLRDSTQSHDVTENKIRYRKRVFPFSVKEPFPC